MFVLLVTLAFAGEVPLDPAALPAPVVAAVQARLPGAVIVAAEQEGKEYEAEVTLGERKIDLAFTADGTWLEEEERVATESLPEAVRATLDRRWKGWAISGVERALLPSGTRFEVVVAKGETRKEVVLTDAGVVKQVETEQAEEGDD